MKDQTGESVAKTDVKAVNESAVQVQSAALVSDNNNVAATQSEPAVASDVAAAAGADVQKTYDRLLPKQTKTIEVDGKSYTLENASKTANNFVYYVENGTLVVEGSDLKITADANTKINDDIKFMGNRNTIDVGDGDDIVEVEGDMNMIYGGAGNDFIKMRGDYNTTDMSDGDDTVWMAGDNNVAMGQKGADNFFAIGNENTFFGQDGVDASYYNETEGIGHEFRVEDKITDATDFEDWVNGNDDDDGPPYVNPPEAPEGHEVRAYDDNTYTDKYEEDPLYYTEYRDIAYRELDAKTTENKVTGEGSVLKYNDDGAESSNISIGADGSVTVKADDKSTTISKDDVVYYDQNGNAVSNPGTLADILEKLATGKLTVGNKDGVVTPGADSKEEVTDSDNTVLPTPPTGPCPENYVYCILPEPEEMATMVSSFNTEIDEGLTAAGNEYIAAMSNKNDDGTFDTSDDAAASQKYSATVNKLNTKRQVVVNTGLPLVNTASILFNSATNKTDDYYLKLNALVMKTLEANRNYFQNEDTESEEELKAEADKANAELQKMLDEKP